MKKILIANRGEIACRIIDSCKKLKFHSIAVYSDIDKNSKHVRKADESIHIGASKAHELSMHRCELTHQLFLHVYCFYLYQNKLLLSET